MNRMHVFTVTMLVAMIGNRSSAAEPDVKLAFFEKEIRPLLIDHCQQCHGERKQQAGLRVDRRADLLKGGDSGPAVVPHKVDQGTLLPAVKHTGETKMPPKNKLTDTQIAALTRWIADGAVWPEEKATATPIRADKHWAFQPLTKPTPPATTDRAWVQTPIDQFILAKLNEQHLKPVASADKRTLIRRVTFDLTGLPPTPDEIAAFLKDESPTAFDKLVERLLASAAYGERWGRHWLDVARYADTAGDGADYPVREAGKYRDWVIKAFNNDQPFDQFIRDQIAGDILAKDAPPEQYADKVTATGFLAIGKRYGYNPSPDYQYLDFADVIDSVGRSLLGLSIGCARCHDHKYEPVSMGDYYALYGILQSTKWSFPGGEEHKRPANFPPLVPPAEASKRDQERATALAKLDQAMTRLKNERGELEGKAFAGGVDLAFEGQALNKPPATPWFSAGPNRVLADSQSPFQHVHPAGKQGVRVGTGLANDGVRYVFPTGLKATPNTAMHFNIDFRTVAPKGNDPIATGAYRFFLSRGVLESLALECSVTATEFTLRNGTKWEVIRKLEPNTWYNLQLTLQPDKKTFRGAIGKLGDVTTFQDKALNPQWDGTINTFICDALGHVAGKAPERDLDNIGLQEKPFAALGSPAVSLPAAPADLKERLAKLDAELADLTKQRTQLTALPPYEVAYAVSEGTPSNARIQKRGEPDKLGDTVPRRFVSILGGDALDPKNTGSGRLELAQWLTRPSNPLTARVFVNRVWQWHFGRGLVATASDFGTRGETPSHPELLDWLTSEFIASGWSVKKLHQLILRSHVYQLASNDDPATSKSDPNNRYLWRYSRRALDAEAIRDSMLAVSGQLDRTPMGQHPFPPTESWGYTIHNPFHAVYDHSRRSVYLMIQRNRRHPFLALFDAADPNLSSAERLPTITPTQSLYLMNSPFVHAQAEAFAKRIAAINGDDSTRAKFAFETAHGVQPSTNDVQATVAFLADYRQKLAGTGQPTEQHRLAAWTALARVLLTSNAFLYVD